MNKIGIGHRHLWLDVVGTETMKVMWCERCGCLLTDHRVEKNSAYSFPDYYWTQTLNASKSPAPIVANR